MFIQQNEGRKLVVIVMLSPLEYYAQAYLSRFLSNRFLLNQLTFVLFPIECSCVCNGKDMFMVLLRLGCTR